MIGPNCMGSSTPTPTYAWTRRSHRPRRCRGPWVRLALRRVRRRDVGSGSRCGLGFSHFVSLGNSADVDINDLLEVWERHDPTRVIMLYLESLPEPQRFLALAKRVGRSKPIVVFKGGARRPASGLPPRTPARSRPATPPWMPSSGRPACACRHSRRTFRLASGPVVRAPAAWATGSGGHERGRSRNRRHRRAVRPRARAGLAVTRDRSGAAGFPTG